MLWPGCRGKSISRRRGNRLCKGPEAGCSKAGVVSVRKGRVGDDAGEDGREQTEPGQAMEQRRPDTGGSGKQFIRYAL